jgi:hypothetical protein
MNKYNTDSLNDSQDINKSKNMFGVIPTCLIGKIPNSASITDVLNYMLYRQELKEWVFYIHDISIQLRCSAFHIKKMMKEMIKINLVNQTGKTTDTRYELNMEEYKKLLQTKWQGYKVEDRTKSKKPWVKGNLHSAVIQSNDSAVIQSNDSAVIQSNDSAVIQSKTDNSITDNIRKDKNIKNNNNALSPEEIIKNEVQKQQLEKSKQILRNDIARLKNKIARNITLMDSAMVNKKPIEYKIHLSDNDILGIDLKQKETELNNL